MVIVNRSAAQGLTRKGHESIATLRKAWHSVDEDYSGYLDRDEVGQLVGLLLGHPISHHGTARALKKMDEVCSRACVPVLKYAACAACAFCVLISLRHTQCDALLSRLVLCF